MCGINNSFLKNLYFVMLVLIKKKLNSVCKTESIRIVKEGFLSYTG